MWWFTPVAQHVGGGGKKNLRSLLSYTGVEGQPGLCDSPRQQTDTKTWLKMTILNELHQQVFSPHGYE